ncbi:response regulator [Agaribacter flavus]|uniref:histidine kinase n=1 Tax=Agaribacter flavus TaxID=1902781 RepID=A0ABV7FQK4_9ALTE
MPTYDILMIDDNVDDVDLCQRKLLTEQSQSKSANDTFNITHVSSGKQGMENLAQAKPYCVLLDYSLPGKDGFTLLREIRQIYPLVPIIVLTGQGNEKLAVEILKGGAQDYLVKSEINNIDLAASIHHAVASVEQPNNLLTKDEKDIRLLIVDDNIDDRELVIRSVKKIKHKQYHCFELDSGSQIIETIRTLEPACILLDYSLPGENGLVVLKKLHEQYPQIPVILFSGQGNEVIAAEAIKAGAFNYLVKREINSESLDTAISQGIEKKHLESLVKEKTLEIRRYQYEALTKKQRYDRVVQATGIIVWEYDLIDEHLYVDKQIQALLGDSLDERTSGLDKLWQRVHPEDQNKVASHWQHYIDAKSNELDLVYRLRRLDGSWCWIHESGKTATRTEDGKPKTITGVYQDVSEKMREEDMLNCLYKATVNNDLSLNDKVADILKKGLDYFGLQVASISILNQGECAISHYQSNISVDLNEVLSLSTYFSSKAFNAHEVYVDNHIEFNSSIDENSDICKRTKVYLGTTIYLNQQAYGTLNFYGFNGTKNEVSVRNKTVLSLLAQWISSEFSRAENIKRIEESKQFLQLMQEAIPDMFFVKDEQFRIVRANDAFLRVYPESVRDSVIGTTTLEAYDEEEAAEFLAHDKQALREGYSETEEAILFPDGKKRILHTKKTRFQNSAGDPFILGISRDVTAIRRTEADHKELHDALENTVEGVSRIDTQGRYTFVNEAYASACGYKPEELVGKNWSITVDESEHAMMATAYEEMLKDGKVTRETKGIRKDGSRFYKAVTMISCFDDAGIFIGHHCFMNDISERKLAQEELIRSNAELERFAYVASHDLQEPLRMVINFTKLLEKYYGDKLDDRAFKYIEYATNGAVRMQQLVKDLLEYARLGNQAETFSAIDLNKMAESVMENLSTSIEAAGASVEWDNLPIVNADPSSICSVFQNLVGNAIKYRKSEVNPIIKVKVKSEAEQWVFAVIDNGIGMKQQYCEKIFEPFKRLHRKEEYSGTGMGLAICRKTIEQMDGKIWAISELEKGSRFYFSLPKSPNV